jgi:hypothetical protein
MRTAIRSTPGKAALAAGLLLIAQGALAWGPQGHRTIGAIADRLLTPAAHGAVLQLLEDDRDKFGNPSGRTTLESVSEGTLLSRRSMQHRGAQAADRGARG